MKYLHNITFEVFHKFYGAKYLCNVMFEVLRKFYDAKYLCNVTFEVLHKVTIHNIYVIMHSKYFVFIVIYLCNIMNIMFEVL